MKRNPPPRHPVAGRGKLKSIERRDIKRLRLINAEVPLKEGQYFRESPSEYALHDEFGKVRPYPKFNNGKLQVIGVIL